MIKCGNCGENNLDSLKECANCGEPLTGSAASNDRPAWGFVKSPDWSEPDFNTELVDDSLLDDESFSADSYEATADDYVAQEYPQWKPSPIGQSDGITTRRINRSGRSSYESYRGAPKRRTAYRRGRGDKRAPLFLIIGGLVMVLLGAILLVVLTKDPSGSNGTNTNKNITIEVNPDDADCFLVKVVAKEGNVVVYETNRGEKSQVTVPAKGYVIFNVPKSALMSIDPVDGATYKAAPKIYLIDKDGNLKPYENVPEVTLDVPKINATFTSEDNLTTDNGRIVIEGTVIEIASDFTINGEKVTINQDGSFAHTVSFEEEGTFSVVAEIKLGGYQIIRKTFVVVVESAVDPATLIQISEGFSTRVISTVDSITVTGTVPVGTTLSVTSAESGFTLVGSPTVSEAGAFSFTVKMANPGNYKMSINATLPDGRTLTRELQVQRAPSYNDYKQNAWAMNYSDMLSQVGKNQGFKLAGTITEILYNEDYIIAKLQITTGEEVIIEYHNHYGSAHAVEAGMSLTQIYGRPTRINEQNVLEIYVWFIDG